MIKEKMYIRTEDGIIDKVLEIDKRMPRWNLKNNGWDSIGNFNGINKNVIKSSFNIIDLIEVGDTVNKTLITKVDLDKKRLEFEEDYGTYYIYAEDIKLILTHEQYEANCFKIGE